MMIATLRHRNCRTTLRHRRSFPMSQWHGIGIYIDLLSQSIVAINCRNCPERNKGRKTPFVASVQA